MSRHLIFVRAFAFAALALHALRLGAHDAWLEPERFAVTPGATLSLGLTSADSFNRAGNPIASATVARAVGRLGGEPVVVVTGVEQGHALQFFATLPRPGVAVFAVELKPRALDIAEDAIERRLRTVHASAELREAWVMMPEPRRWRETFVQHTKTFVRIGEPAADDRGWAEPLGLGLEIVPEHDPTALKVGDVLPVRVVRAGAPLAAFVLAFVSAGETHEHVVVTDENGRAGATLEVSGLWLVHGTDLRKSTSAGREWDSDSTTLVIEVAPRAATPESK